MSTPTSANPTLTIVALALRQAEYISREMAARNI
jgi:choline dehydrogenase-like flavoprotein